MVVWCESDSVDGGEPLFGTIDQGGIIRNGLAKPQKWLDWYGPVLPGCQNNSQHVCNPSWCVSPTY